MNTPRPLYDEMSGPLDASLAAGLDSTVHSHLIGFTAEESRATGRTVNIEEFQERNRPG